MNEILAYHTETGEEYIVDNFYAWRKNKDASNSEFKKYIEAAYKSAEDEGFEFPGDYLHFKDKKYKAYRIVVDSQSGELLVFYQALYGDKIFYLRPLKMFMSDVDKDKYPDIEQKKRFKLCK